MLCCSTSCKKFETCGQTYLNNPNRHENLELFDKFGSGSYTYNSHTGIVECKTWTMCNNYSMYYPAHGKEGTEPYQITMDDLFREIED